VGNRSSGEWRRIGHGRESYAAQNAESIFAGDGCGASPRHMAPPRVDHDETCSNKQLIVERVAARLSVVSNQSFTGVIPEGIFARAETAARTATQPTNSDVLCGLRA
jgi:hypothetical protein